MEGLTSFDKTILILLFFVCMFCVYKIISITVLINKVRARADAELAKLLKEIE